MNCLCNSSWTCLLERKMARKINAPCNEFKMVKMYATQIVSIIYKVKHRINKCRIKLKHFLVIRSSKAMNPKIQVKPMINVNEKTPKINRLFFLLLLDATEECNCLLEFIAVQIANPVIPKLI